MSRTTKSAAEKSKKIAGGFSSGQLESDCDGTLNRWPVWAESDATDKWQSKGPFEDPELVNKVPSWFREGLKEFRKPFDIPLSADVTFGLTVVDTQDSVSHWTR
jgi:hypothetical protein